MSRELRKEFSGLQRPCTGAAQRAGYFLACAQVEATWCTQITFLGTTI